MPWLRNTLAWATPVKAELICAHLEAYGELLPTIVALRLCHRNAINSTISKLPVELLVSIEDFIMDAERNERRQEWHSLYLCHQEACSPRDHYDHSRLQDWRRMIRLDTARSEVLSQEDVDERLDDFIMDHTSYLDVHWDRRCTWVERTVLSGSAIDLKRKELMTKYFGLELWLSRTRGTEGDSYWSSGATLAYLKLPQTTTGTRHFDLSEQERENREFYFSGSGAMELAGDLTLPKNGRAKIERCLSVLGLEPYRLDTEGNFELSADAAKVAEEKGGEGWPRLTVLTEFEASMDD